MQLECYKDPTKSIPERVEDLLGRMNLAEKLAQLGCVWITALVQDDRLDPDKAAAVIPDGIGQVTRIGAATGLRPADSAALMNDIQRVALERTRLGIPVVVHEEATGGYCARDATVFPQALGLASTWDLELVGEVASVIREQMLAVGARQALAPVLDVARDPRWGRVEETYGEDPVLAGAMGTAYVRALQTEDLAGGVIATGKHFLGHAMPDGGRNHAPVHLGQRELREVHAEPFAAAIRDAQLASVMNSYSSVDGLPCAGSPEILTDLLRGELGFEGTVVADYFAVALLQRHHRTAGGRGEAALQALRAGLDVELPEVDCFGEPLSEAIRSGQASEEIVDAAVRRVLEGKFRLGLFERPYVDPGSAPARFDTVSQRHLARRAAQESLVLLANDGILPLPKDLGRVAVMGPGADDRRLLQGDYHYPAHQEVIYESSTDGAGSYRLVSEVIGDRSTNGMRASREDPPSGGEPSDRVQPGAEVGEHSEANTTIFLPEAGGAFQPGPYYITHVTPLQGIRALLGDQVVVSYEKGCEVTGSDYSGAAAAVELARQSDVAIVVVAGRSGLRPACTVGEARDATNLDLTGLQQQLVIDVAATGTPTVVVVLSGRVHTLSRVAEVCSALIQAWPLGEEGGHALAEALFGDSEPSGRLPVTLPRHVGQVPLHSGHRAGGSRAMFFGDYTDSPASPLFAFGHGLSYAEFDYSSFEVEATTTADPILVRAKVTNVARRKGTEVVQLYGSDIVASLARPGRQLLGFTRLDLEPEECAEVLFRIHPSRLAFFDHAMHFVTEPGEFGFGLGPSSVRLPLQAVVKLTGAVQEYRQAEIVATAVETGSSRVPG